MTARRSSPFNWWQRTSLQCRVLNLHPSSEPYAGPFRNCSRSWLSPYKRNAGFLSFEFFTPSILDKPRPPTVACQFLLRTLPKQQHHHFTPHSSRLVYYSTSCSPLAPARATHSYPQPPIVSLMHISSRHHRNSQQQQPQILMHGALAFAPQNRQSYHTVPEIHWDIRASPSHARSAADGHHLPSALRRAFATRPALPALYITCGLFPSADWGVVVQNPSGVTVDDVLTQLYQTMRKRISGKEWARLGKQQQAVVADAFHRRTRASPDPNYEHTQGVRRIDWLISSTQFVGLTPSTEAPLTWTLTTKRAKQ